MNGNSKDTKTIKYQDPVNHEVKNSWIYNKYFKDYKGEGVIEEPEILLTREELQKKVINDYIERIKAKQRISQIKPKKMMFSNNNTMIPDIYASQNNAHMNQLFKFH